jgi:hypothetical protein
METTSLSTLKGISDAENPSSWSPRKSKIQNCDSDDDDDDDEDAPLDKPRDMHVSLSKTNWKALNSDMPHMGLGFFQMLLQNNQVPPAQVLKDFMNLLTFGPHYHKHAFWDGYRMNRAYQYVDALLDKDPQMTHHLTQATGTEYWRTVMDQVKTFTYPSDGSDDSILQSLLLNNVSLKLFERLLVQSCEQSAQFTSCPLLDSLDKYGGKAACQVVAQTMASFWVQYGHSIWETSTSSKVVSSSSTPKVAGYSSVVQAIMDRLVHIVGLLLQRYCNSKNGDKDARDILCHAMNSQLLTCHQTKKWIKESKLYWTIQFPTQMNQSLVAKQLGVEKEYEQWMSF